MSNNTDTAQKRGTSDASQNKGPLSPGSFRDDATRKAYETGYQQEKRRQDEERRKKQNS